MYVRVTRSIFNTPRRGEKDNLTIFLLFCDLELLNNIAEEIELMVFNKEKEFIEAFLVSIAHEFEHFKEMHIQNILLFILREEFDLDNYLA